MDNSYGIYVSIRNAEGVLVSSNRSEWALVKEDLEAIFGDEFVGNMIGSMRGGQVEVGVSGSLTATHQATVAAAPVLAAVPTVQNTTEMTAEEVSEILNTPTEAAAPAQQFDDCAICGTLKDQWKPPGISKAGKKYPGFFACPNFRNHPR